MGQKIFDLSPVPKSNGLRLINNITIIIQSITKNKKCL